MKNNKKIFKNWKLKNKVLSWQNMNASLRSALAISEYFMPIQWALSINTARPVRPVK
jgi:hypothetical protein